MQRQQNIRLNGAEFDAIMYGISEEQKEILEENPKLKPIYDKIQEANNKAKGGQQ